MPLSSSAGAAVRGPVAAECDAPDESVTTRNRPTVEITASVNGSGQCQMGQCQKAGQCQTAGSGQCQTCQCQTAGQVSVRWWVRSVSDCGAGQCQTGQVGVRWVIVRWWVRSVSDGWSGQCQTAGQVSVRRQSRSVSNGRSGQCQTAGSGRCQTGQCQTAGQVSVRLRGGSGQCQTAGSGQTAGQVGVRRRVSSVSVSDGVSGQCQTAGQVSVMAERFGRCNSGQTSYHLCLSVRKVVACLTFAPAVMREKNKVNTSLAYPYLFIPRRHQTTQNTTLLVL